jgi:hypothetical protein
MPEKIEKFKLKKFKKKQFLGFFSIHPESFIYE